jgi:hypothetical protein
MEDLLHLEDRREHEGPQTGSLRLKLLKFPLATECKVEQKEKLRLQPREDVEAGTDRQAWGWIRRSQRREETRCLRL